MQLIDAAPSNEQANLNLEDKVDLQGGSNVVTEIVDWEANKAATKDGHMDKISRSFRRIIPPKRLRDYVRKGDGHVYKDKVGWAKEYKTAGKRH